MVTTTTTTTGTGTTIATPTTNINNILRHMVAVSRTGYVFSPLAPDHSKKREIVCSNQTRKFNLYVGENFCMKIPYSLDLTHLINNTANSGFITTDFFSSTALRSIKLTTGGHKMLSTPNAGGGSIISEVLSFEVLGRCFGAKLKRTEMEISYFPRGGCITDYVCELSHATVGVSVTRAWKYRGLYDLVDAVHLLNKKLRGVNQSTMNSLVKWKKQILHVWSASEHVTNTLIDAYNNYINNELKSNTIVLVSTATKADYIFNNG